MNNDLKKMDDYMQSWLQKAEKYPENLIHLKPTENEWSLQQVLLHIVQIQNAALTVLNKQMQKMNELQTVKLKNWYRYILLKLALRSNKKFKAPKIVANVPNDVSVESVREQWNQSMQQLTPLIENFPSSEKNKLIFKHPVIGWITIGQTTGFMLEHLKHHQKQIESLYLQLDKK